MKKGSHDFIIGLNCLTVILFTLYSCQQIVYLVYRSAHCDSGLNAKLWTQKKFLLSSLFLISLEPVAVLKLRGLEAEIYMGSLQEKIVGNLFFLPSSSSSFNPL